MHPTERLVRETIISKTLLPVGCRVVVGVSGGPDSVALLHVLAALRGDLGIVPVAVYVDHGLRPGEVEEEQGLVAGLAKHLNLQFLDFSVDVRTYARQEKMSLEQAARELRYAILHRVSDEFEEAPIAVAHTADDQAEEILIRLIRGGGRKALSGMRFKSNGIVRPFLSIRKKEIISYLREKNISFCLDSSNRDMRFLRNRVRHRLLPYLERNFDRGIRSALCKTADTLAEDDALLDEMAERCLAEMLVKKKGNPGAGQQPLLLDRSKLVNAPAAMQRRVIEKILWQVGGRASYDSIIKIMSAARSGKVGAEYHFSKGLRLGVQKEYLEFLFPRGKVAWRGRLYERD